MRKIFAFTAACALVAWTIAARPNAPAPVCRVSPARELVGVYPEHPLSPQQSLLTFDTVLFGEVVVPSRKCSLGYCAGIRVIQQVKGKVGATTLVRVASPEASEDGACASARFSVKGDRWMIFANQGTSRGGQKFLDISPDGPSFAANKVPDFKKLEGQYRNMQAQLEQAIGEKLGRWR